MKHMSKWPRFKASRKASGFFLGLLLCLNLCLFETSQAKSKAPIIDFSRAQALMKEEYQGYFNRAKPDFGVTTEDYYEQLEYIRDQLKKSGIIRALSHDPWREAPPEDAPITIDVLALYSQGFYDKHDEDQTTVKNRLRLTEMLTNIALYQSGLPLRMRFKIVPFGPELGSKDLLSPSAYLRLRDKPQGNLNALLAKDPQLKTLRKRWGADLALLSVAPEERILPPNGKKDGCGLAHAKGPVNIVATATVAESGFCSEILTASHELSHLLGAPHPSSPHEAKVSDPQYPYRFSLMGYRDQLCKDIKPQCLRTLSFVEASILAIEARYETLAKTYPAILWP